MSTRPPADPATAAPAGPAGAAPAAPVAAASVLLLRDGSAGLEVLMVERHHAIDFAHGALVFPGGKVASSDREPGLAGHCAPAALSADALALRVAAIRETFEESGVLLARRGRATAPLTAAEQREIADRHRTAVDRGERGLLAVAVAEDVQLAVDLLVPFAHWITPEFMPKRFDTHFFALAAPAETAVVHDGREAVDAVWIGPSPALDDAARGTRKIIFPTRMNLAKLARSSDVEDALTAARATPPVTVLPRVSESPDGPVLRIPPEADYGVTEVPVRDAH